MDGAQQRQKSLTLKVHNLMSRSDKVKHLKLTRTMVGESFCAEMRGRKHDELSALFETLVLDLNKSSI